MVDQFNGDVGAPDTSGELATDNKRSVMGKTARKGLDPEPWLRAVRELYEPLMADVVEETYRHLAPQDAGHLIEIYNELLDLDIAIRDAYRMAGAVEYEGHQTR